MSNVSFVRLAAFVVIGVFAFSVMTAVAWNPTVDWIARATWQPVTYACPLIQQGVPANATAGNTYPIYPIPCCYPYPYVTGSAGSTVPPTSTAIACSQYGCPYYCPGYSEEQIITMIQIVGASAAIFVAVLGILAAVAAVLAALAIDLALVKYAKSVQKRAEKPTESASTPPPIIAPHNSS